MKKEDLKGKFRIVDTYDKNFIIQELWNGKWELYCDVGCQTLLEARKLLNDVIERQIKQFEIDNYQPKVIEVYGE